MARSTKRVPAAKAARDPSAPSPRRSSAGGRPYLRFYHPVPLRTKTLAILDRLELAPDATRHRDALAGVVVDLTESGMDAFFIQPLKLARAGFIVERTASLGVAGAVSVMSAVVHRVIGSMGSPQLLSVCGSVRKLMR
jgi:hypothetical protein